MITPEQLEKQRNDVDSTIVMFYAPVVSERFVQCSGAAIASAFFPYFSV